MHQTYRIDQVNDVTKFKEYVIKDSGGLRIDFIDFSTKSIYELKPNNPRAIGEGLVQVEKYKNLIEEQFGPGAGKQFSPSIKEAARLESGNTCVFCGVETVSSLGETQSHIDHAIPKSVGGNNTMMNA